MTRWRVRVNGSDFMGDVVSAGGWICCPGRAGGATREESSVSLLLFIVYEEARTQRSNCEGHSFRQGHSG